MHRTDTVNNLIGRDRRRAGSLMGADMDSAGARTRIYPLIKNELALALFALDLR